MAEEIEQPKPPRPIIVIKKKVAGHGGHHGGAWKVAYADFVTAMMALFIVLWLMNSDKETQQAVSAFFNNPSGPGKLTGTAAAGLGNSIDINKDDMSKLRDKIQQALMTVPNFRNLKDHVEITITSDGLRIEMLESEAGTFFESGRPAPTESGTELLTRLAQELGKLPNNLLIEGHTDSKPYNGDGTYSNWELSTDRANSARKLMQEHGIRPEQVAQVRGFADRQLRRPEEPESASNRRISVIVQYLAGPQTPPTAEPEGKPAEGKPAEGKAAEGKAAEGKAAEGKPAEGKAAEGKPAEGKAAEGKPAENKPAEAKPAAAPPHH